MTSPQGTTATTGFSTTTTTSHGTTATTITRGPATPAPTGPRADVGATTLPADLGPAPGPCTATATKPVSITKQRVQAGVRVAAFADVLVTVQGTVEIDGRTTRLRTKTMRVDASQDAEKVVLTGPVKAGAKANPDAAGVVTLTVQCTRVAGPGMTAADAPVVPSLGVPEHVVVKKKPGTAPGEELDDWTVSASTKWTVVPGLVVAAEFEPVAKGGEPVGQFGVRIIRTF